MIKILMMAACLLSAQMAAAQTCKDTIPASTPDSRFIVNGDEVTDTDTGLIWQRCTLGQTGSDCSDDSASTYTWQQALQVASAPWRLPNAKELRSIVEEKCHDPAINLTIFPNTQPSNYCSASPNAYDSSNAWYVGFNVGYSGSNPKSDGKYVRLVRDGGEGDSCVESPAVKCMGPTPDWPTFHEPTNHYINQGITHAWSFVYKEAIEGQIGAVLSLGIKNIKISEVAGDTATAGLDCWRDFGEYIYYEPAAGTDQYSCNLTVGRQYYCNIRNMMTSLFWYQLKGFDQ